MFRTHLTRAYRGSKPLRLTAREVQDTSRCGGRAQRAGPAGDSERLAECWSGPLRALRAQNAQPSVLRAASDITGSNDEDGVASHLERYYLD